ncbi:ParB-like protein [Xanthobacter sp. VTT E-85241]|uniref:ParB-like protein n=1 Tax=Roseixanthobacter finlandensis TaxID=3119922 RepID=UPI0037262734
MGNRTIAIDDLHPTQLTLGMSEVTRRAKRMAALDKDDLDDLVHKRPVPCVIGPKGQLYMIDHHHLCRALLLCGRTTAVQDIAGTLDWSHMNADEFWPAMDRAGMCWPIDADGNRRPYVRIPGHVRELTDNPWRTLARGVRGTAFRDDDDTPFKEFMWGEYFRTFMSKRLIETSLDLAEDLALKLALLDEAQDLPGYIAKGK